MFLDEFHSKGRNLRTYGENIHKMRQFSFPPASTLLGKI